MSLLEIIILLLVILWALGAFAFPVVAIGSLIHLLLVIAIILLLFRLIRGQSI